MRKHATPTSSVPVNLNPGVQLRELASRTSQWPPALEWWKKVDDAHRLTVEDRRDYVSAALVTGDIAVAAKQVDTLLAQPGGAVADRHRVCRVKSLLATAILYWHSITPSARWRINAQDRKISSPLLR